MNDKAASIQEKESKSCFANQLAIQGAIEMYCLDNGTEVEQLTTALCEELIKSGYIQGLPDDPGQGANIFSNYCMDETGEVYCTVHGEKDRI